jgi:hypothetical protein
VFVSRPVGGLACPSVARVETPTAPRPDPASFTRTVAQVQSYVRSDAGAYTALLTSAEQDPAGTTMSLLALGAVLLDLAAGAFSLTSDEMLAKVSAGILQHADSTV